MNAITPPTPENVADMLTSGDNDYHDGNDWWPSITAEDNVISIGITPVGEDYETKLDEVHFRAVVVEGETTPGDERLAELLTEAEQLRTLVADLADSDPCWYDHHGGCQAHGYLSLGPGERCPHAVAQELLDATREVTSDG